MTDSSKVLTLKSCQACGHDGFLVAAQNIMLIRNAVVQVEIAPRGQGLNDFLRDEFFDHVFPPSIRRRLFDAAWRQLVTSLANKVGRARRDAFFKLLHDAVLTQEQNFVNCLPGQALFQGNPRVPIGPSRQRLKGGF